MVIMIFKINCKVLIFELIYLLKCSFFGYLSVASQIIHKILNKNYVFLKIISNDQFIDYLTFK